MLVDWLLADLRQSWSVRRSLLRFCWWRLHRLRRVLHRCFLRNRSNRFRGYHVTFCQAGGRLTQQGQQLIDQDVPTHRWRTGQIRRVLIQHDERIQYATLFKQHPARNALRNQQALTCGTCFIQTRESAMYVVGLRHQHVFRGTQFSGHAIPLTARAVAASSIKRSASACSSNCTPRTIAR